MRFLTFLQVLANVRNKLVAYSSGIDDFEILVGRAQKYLLARGCLPHLMKECVSNMPIEKPIPVPKGKSPHQTNLIDFMWCI